jgi:hypothetical protein
MSLQAARKQRVCLGLACDGRDKWQANYVPSFLLPFLPTDAAPITTFADSNGHLEQLIIVAVSYTPTATVNVHASPLEVHCGSNTAR